ncbi:MAG: hypothetical protein AABZ12_13960 [Planctomycetota bacterium]
MAIVAGIDEAGFGPLLGPLVVSGVAFRVPDARVNDCLWETLAETCSRETSRGERRMAIADSKKLFRGRGSLVPLERAALVMLAVSGKHPQTWRELIHSVAPHASDQLESYPWYCASDAAIPLERDVGDVGTRANAVRRNGREQGVDLIGVFCEPLAEGHYNRLVAGTRNKAVALLGLALRVLGRVLRCGEDRLVRIGVDRLGGRMHYRDALATAFPGYELRIVEENQTCSAYRLADGSRVIRVEFAVGGEQRHFAVALASVYSKYLRELFMHVFNGYWSGQQPGLEPTAGYYTDAQRWLKDAAPSLRRLNVKTDLLVRRQ